MISDCPYCSTSNEIAAPTAPTPGGVVAVQCSNCGKGFEIDNPLGDETYRFIGEVWLFPVVETIPAARGTQRRAVTGYQKAEPGDPGAVKFAPGDGIQRVLLPSGFAEEGDGE